MPIDAGQPAQTACSGWGSFNTLRARVLMLVAAAALACLLAASVLVVGAVRHFGLNLLYQQCSSLASRLMTLHPDLLQQLNQDRLALTDQLRANLVLQPNTRIDIIDAAGRPLLSTAATASNPLPAVPDYDIGALRQQLALDPLEPTRLVDVSDSSRPRVLSGRPLTAAADSPWLVISVHAPNAAIEMTEIVRSYVLKTGAKATVIALSIGLIVTMGILAILTRPLITLTRRVDRLRQPGTEDPAVALADFPFTMRQDEIGHLARAFRETFSRLHDETRRVQTTDQRRRDMVASVSHDLRTPLTALLGQLEVVRAKGDGLAPAEQRRLVDAAFNNGQQLKRLTDALAELGRLENPDLCPAFEPLAVQELCDDVASRYQCHAREQQVDLQVEFPDRLPLARADAQLLDRALGNLIDNAIRVTPAQGRITVEIDRSTIADQPALRISVTDTGPGVAPEDRERVFERFYQGGGSHRANRGSAGLGLAIVGRVAELHHGHAGLTSPESGGACFYLLLPLDPASVRQSPASHDAAAGRPATGPATTGPAIAPALAR